MNCRINDCKKSTHIGYKVVHWLKANLSCVHEHQPWMNEDAWIADRYDNLPIRKNVENLQWAIKRTFTLLLDYAYRSVACIKVDLAENQTADRSLNISIYESTDGHIVTLTWKMSETLLWQTRSHKLSLKN